MRLRDIFRTATRAVPAMQSGSEKKPKFDDLADAGSIKWALYILWPVFLGWGMYLYCQSYEHSCQDRKEAVQEEKAKAKKPDDLAVSHKTGSVVEQKSTERNTPLKCSVPCNLVNRALDDPVGFFTALLVYVVYVQVLLMFRQETWLRRSFKAAATSANAALGSGRIAQDTANKELRAYLGATPQDVKFITGTYIQTYVELSNTGATPAKSVRQRIKMEIRDPTDNKVFPEPEPGYGKRPIAPGAKWPIGVEMPITDEQVQKLHDREKVLFVWGRADYTDTFGNDQWITFRYQNIGNVFVMNEKGERQSTGWALFAEPEGNDVS